MRLLTPMEILFQRSSLCRVAPEKIKPSSVDDAKKDYDYTRGNLYSLIEKGQEPQ